MASASSKNVHYCGIVLKVVLLSAVFLFTVLPARSQFTPYSPNEIARNIQLPDGAGKPIVQRACSLCHLFSRFQRVDFDREDWDNLVHTMHAWGAPLSEKEIPIVVDYLSTNFKDDDETRRGVTVPGKIKATITEWDMPTPYSLPHDSIYSPRTGLTWVTEQFGNALAQFNPETKTIKEYRLPRVSGPHMLLEDEDGNIFYDSHSEGFIGKFDPQTGKVLKEYAIPGPKLILHDIALDKTRGFVWFAVMEARPPLYPVGSKIGRLNTKTGEVKLGDVPTRNAAPYGLALTSKGVPFFTEDDAPRLGTVDPDTMKVTEYSTPDPKSGTRRLSITPDDIVWYTDNRRGYLGRFDPKTGKFSEWPSPSGPRSFPYGIAVSGDAVWYAESHSKPNMIVRFDMKTETFQSWPIKAGGGIKHIYAQPDGNIWFTRTMTNGIGFVHIDK